MVNAGPIFIEFMVTFIQIVDIDKQYSSLLTSVSDITSMQCVTYMFKNPLYVWTMYNSERRECIASLCGSLPVLEQVNSSNSYYRKVNDKRISSCSDVQSASPTSGDGEYWIYPDSPTFLGCPTKIYCHNMNTASPSEFVTLPFVNTGVLPKLSNFKCRGEKNYLTGEVTKTPGTTHFNRIRIFPENMTVDREDYTFSNTIGAKQQYGQATDCYNSRNNGLCGPKGTFHIDTRGTGMLVDLQQEWKIFGWMSYSPEVTRSAGGVVVDLLCGGFCGGCHPTGGLRLHRNPTEVLPPEEAIVIRPQ